MLRTSIVTGIISGFVLATAGLASAEPLVRPLPQTPVGLEVRSDDGTLLGHTTQVERNAAGRIVAAEAPGLEPADAPRAPNDMVASRNQGEFIPASWRRTPSRDVIGGGTTRTR